MPTIAFRDSKIECEAGANLRSALLKAHQSPHNGNAQWLNCRGMGTCGTCAVALEGPVSEKTAREKWRLDFPPHKQPSPLRLACQVKVLGDVTVKKHNGFWGEKVPHGGGEK